MTDNQRFKALRGLPCCRCGSSPCDVAHANWQEMGKGKGIKADDRYTISLCRACHQNFDAYSLGMDKAQSKEWFLKMLDKTNRALGYKDESAF